MKISIIIPTINSELFISTSLKRLNKILEKFQHEIIIINDFSSDNTFKIIKDEIRSNKKIKLFSNKKKEGQFNSLVKGIKKSSGEAIITLDDDEEYDYSNISKLIKSFNSKKYDLVIGYSVKDNRSFLRRLGRFFINYHNRSKIIPFIITSSFRIMTKSFGKKIVKYHNKKNEPFGPLILNLTHKIKNISVKRSKSPLRKYSNYSFFQLLKIYVTNI